MNSNHNDKVSETLTNQPNNKEENYVAIELVDDKTMMTGQIK